MLDTQLNFIVVSVGAEREWGKTQSEMENKTVEEVFPEILSSKNYRNILKVLETGSELSDVIESRSGKILRARYIPLKHQKLLVGMRINAVPLNEKA